MTKLGRTRQAILSGAAVAALALGWVPGGASAQEMPTLDVGRPLSLGEVLRLAEERNLGFQQSQLGIESAEGGLRSTRSQLLPSASLGLDYSRSVSNFTGTRFDTNTGQILTANQTNVTVESALSLRGGLPLLDPSIWESVRQSSKNLSATVEGVERSRQTLAYDMTRLYFELFRAKELVRVTEEAYTLSQEQLQRAQALYDLGSVARSDVLQAQVNLASADRDRISALNRVEQERARLAVAIGVRVDTPVDVEDPGALPSVPDPANEGTLVSTALERRPDVSRAAFELEAARHGLASSKWDRWPSLRASYFWSKRGAGPDDVLKSFDRDISYGGAVALSWTLFDGLNTKGAIQRAQAEVATRERAFEEARLQTALEVREARLGIKNATESIRSAEEGVRLAEESAKLQQALYESGGGTLLEWNNAQVELTRARVSLVEAQVDLRLALAQLELATGRLASR